MSRLLLTLDLYLRNFHCSIRNNAFYSSPNNALNSADRWSDESDKRPDAAMQREFMLNLDAGI